MKSKSSRNPFAQNPEAELARRLKFARHLSREEFFKRLRQLQKKREKP